MTAVPVYQRARAHTSGPLFTAAARVATAAQRGPQADRQTRRRRTSEVAPPRRLLRRVRRRQRIAPAHVDRCDQGLAALVGLLDDHEQRRAVPHALVEVLVGAALELAVRLEPRVPCLHPAQLLGAL